MASFGEISSNITDGLRTAATIGGYIAAAVAVLGLFKKKWVVALIAAIAAGVLLNFPPKNLKNTDNSSSSIQPVKQVE